MADSLTEQLSAKVRQQAMELRMKQDMIEELSAYKNMCEERLADQQQLHPAGTSGRDPSMIALEAHYEKQVKRLNAQLNAMERELTTTRQRCTELIGKRDELQATLDQTGQKQKLSAKQMTAMRRRLREAESVLESKTQSLTQLEAKVASGDSSHNRTNTRLRKRVKDLEKLSEDLRESLQQEAVAGEEARAYISVLKAALAEKATEAGFGRDGAAFLADFESQKREIARLEAELSEANGHIDQLKIDSEAAQMVQNLQAQITELNEHRTALLDYVRELKEISENQADEIATLRQKETELESHKVALTEAKEMTGRLSRTVSELEPLQGELTRERELAAALTDQLKTAQSELSQKDEFGKTVSVEVQNLRHQLNALQTLREQEADTHRRETAALHDTIQDRTSTIGHLQGTVRSLEDSIRTLREEVNTREQRAVSATRHSEDVQRTVEELTIERDNLSAQLSKTSQDLSASEREKDSMKQQFSTEILSLKQQLSTVQGQKIDRERELDTRRDEISGLHLTIQEKTANVGHLQGTIRSLEDSIVHLREQVGSHQQRAVAASQHSEDVQRTVQELTVERDNLSKQLSEARKELSQVEQSKERLSHTIEQHQSETSKQLLEMEQMMTSLETRSSQAERARETAEARVIELKAELDMLNNIFLKKVKSSTQQLKEREEQLHTAEESLARLQQENTALSSRVLLLSERLSSPAPTRTLRAAASMGPVMHSTITATRPAFTPQKTMRDTEILETTRPLVDTMIMEPPRTSRSPHRVVNMTLGERMASLQTALTQSPAPASSVQTRLESLRSRFNTLRQQWQDDPVLVEHDPTVEIDQETQ